MQLGLIGQEQEQLPIEVVAFKLLKRISLHLVVLVGCARSLKQLGQVLVNGVLKLANTLPQPPGEVSLALGVEQGFIKGAVSEHGFVLV